MAKYKIVHLITSLKVGGAENIVCNLIRKIDSDLFENFVIYFYEGPNVEKLKSLGIPTFQIKGLICKYDPIFFCRLLRTIKKINPDCIHSSLWSANIFGIIVSKLLRIPIICVLHLASNFEATGKNSPLRTYLDRIFLPMANKIVAVSDSMVKDLQKDNGNWFPFGKLKVIKNGVDIDDIQNQAKSVNFKKGDFAINENSFIIGCVSRFVPRKNHLMLLESFALLNNDYQNIQLVLVGYGPLENDLRNRNLELGISDKVLFLKTDQACSIYPLFDCFVLPSNNESFGLVTLEAMVFGIPCIVTSSTRNHEIITDQIDGYLINENDKIGLYDSLRLCYQDRVKWAEIGLNGRANVTKNFNIDLMVKNYADLFTDVCK